MGLEMVEIVMECEDEFGISIPDPLASKVRTVADLRDLIVHLALPVEAASFSRDGVRTDVVRVIASLGIKTDGLDDTTPLRACVPGWLRHRLWTRLQERFASRLPRLRMPYDGTGAVFGSVVVSIVIGSVYSGGIGGLLAGAGVAVLGWVVCKAVFHLAPALPDCCQTIGQLMDYTVACKAPNTPADAVFMRLRTILAEQLGMCEEQIRPEDRFVEDLNCG